MDRKIEMPENPVVLFDGVCNLCNRSVQFIIRHDKQMNFRFASLQSDFAQQVLSDSVLVGFPVESIILYSKGQFYLRSQAVIRIAKILGGFFKLASLLQIVPGFILDAMYDITARHRYRWFGKRDICMVPDAGISDRFLTQTTHKPEVDP